MIADNWRIVAGQDDFGFERKDGLTLSSAGRSRVTRGVRIFG